MLLYHGTHSDNCENIEIVGLSAVLSEKECANDERLNQEAVFGFDNYADAVDFMVYDCSVSINDVTVYAFEASETVIDPEYNGNAYAVLNDIDANELEVVNS